MSCTLQWSRRYLHIICCREAQLGGLSPRTLLPGIIRPPPPSLKRAITGRLLSSSSSSPANPIQRYPLAIVGGGPSGLFLASLLQRFNVDFVLLEALSVEEHFTHPQAHFLNTRTMEILKRYTPCVFDKVMQAMPPVTEWNQFRFGPCMRTTKDDSTETMATVRHPVHVPICSQRNANGVLLVDDNPLRNACEEESGDADIASIPLSDCSVGHLAQHTFSRILYEKVQRDLSPSSSLEFGTRVVHANPIINKDSTMNQSTTSVSWHIQTDTGAIYQTPFVVAADGAKSTWRQDYLKIGMTGQPTIQRLINVHFTLNQEDADDLPPAMLYTVFSPHVLAMVVRHSPTDYVMQIPYFPPYQTVEDDFSLAKVKGMVQAALGRTSSSSSPNNKSNNSSSDFQIRSIRPWTMGSLVAESYGKDNVFLVGDAAHVFPPAGGFGMNTGLHDALALAWRLKYLVHDGHGPEQPEGGNAITAAALAKVYTRERQPVAHNNAALSVRNYHRVLAVMKSCYLDERNLPILFKSLEVSAQLGMPLSWQKAAFQNIFRTALLPLQALKDAPHSLYARRVTYNLRRLLQSGQGLPLLFPNYEIGFSYPTPLQNQHHRLKGPNAKRMENDDNDWSKDSTADPPLLMVGRLFPHIPCRVKKMRAVSSCGGAILSSNSITTTRDLSAQLATAEKPCPFCLLCISFAEAQQQQQEFDLDNTMTSDNTVAGISVMLEERLGGIAVLPAHLEIGPDDDDSVDGSADLAVTYLWTSRWEWERRNLLDQVSSSTSSTSSSGGMAMLNNHHRPLLVLIRPDGHVAGIVDRTDEDAINELLMAARYTLESQ